METYLFQPDDHAMQKTRLPLPKIIFRGGIRGARGKAKCRKPFYLKGLRHFSNHSAGMMNESELKIFSVTIGSSVGKPTSTPMTLRPLFATRTVM